MLQQLDSDALIHIDDLEFQDDGEIIIEDLFGYSEYLTTMLNGGKNVSKLAYSKAHLVLLQHQDVHAKVV